LLGGLAVHHQLADCEHQLIFPWGYLAGRVFKRARIRPARPSRRLTALYAIGAAVAIAASLTACARLLPPPKTFRSVSGQVLSVARVVDTQYPSPALGVNRQVLVMLPPGYDNTTAHYPVVVFLHGYPGVPATTISYGKLEAAQVASGVEPFIGVVPDGNGPALKDSWWLNLPNQALGTAVVRDLHKWVTSTFRVTSSWSYAGVSSGGFGAAYLSSISPFPVHAVCGVSGWYYNGSVPPLAHAGAAVRAKAGPIANADRAAPITFLSYGTTDGRARVTTLAYAAALQRAHRKVIVRSYSGYHGWGIFVPALLACLRDIKPARADGGGTVPVASPPPPSAPQPAPLPAGASPARMITTEYPASALGSDRNVVVLLPAGYDSSPRRHYPVVELLHGDPGNPALMISLGHLRQAQVATGVAPFIGVAPDGNGPVVKYSWWANIPGQAMGTAVTTDLHDWMQHTFRINDSWSYAGLSSGGFAAAYLPMIAPYPVHAVCGLSGYYSGNIPPLAAYG
ncbi:MAG: alpha/beta hydrolase, partial [Streptosporangiaceae bacterium]